MRYTPAWRAASPHELVPTRIERRDLRPDDVAVRIDYCGLCHSDLHALRSYDGSSTLVPGHEFTGIVSAVGAAVEGLGIGERVAVGNIIDSCGECAMCRRDQENFCRSFPTLTYGGVDRHDSSPTLGGFSGEYVVRESFAHRLPSGLDSAAAAPLMCAGVTVWEPLRALAISPRSRVAVVGLGGLGHLAVKFALALGAKVSVISRSDAKREDARRLGAHDFIVSTDPEQMDAAREGFDLVMDTVSTPHGPADYLSLVDLDGTLSFLGHLGEVSLEVTDLLIGRKKLSSAGSGGLAATAEMLEFCAEHSIVPDIEVLPSSEINAALERLARNDVRYRFVLDMSDLER